jgi:hypothetical protein
MKRLIVQISIISFVLGLSQAYAQNTLLIEITEIEKKLEVKAKNDRQNQSFSIDDSDKLFSSCYKVDDIVSKTDYGNPKIIKRLNNEIEYLSKTLINPLLPLIDSCEIINILVSESSVRIPFEFLRYRDDFIYKQKPILFCYEKINVDQIQKIDFQKGFIVCDLTSDPENACGAVHKKISSDFHYITDLNIDTIRHAHDMDFILMSIHGNINIKSCDGYMSVNRDKLIPSIFTQKKLKLVYFDSCHLGKGKNFIDRFKSLNAEYYIGPIISSEAGNSSTKTMLAFFRNLENYDPLVSLMKTKKELITYSNNNSLVELWFAAPFRLYKLN